MRQQADATSSIDRDNRARESRGVRRANVAKRAGWAALVVVLAFFLIRWADSPKLTSEEAKSALVEANRDGKLGWLVPSADAIENAPLLETSDGVVQVAGVEIDLSKREFHAWQRFDKCAVGQTGKFVYRGGRWIAKW